MIWRQQISNKDLFETIARGSASEGVLGSPGFLTPVTAAFSRKMRERVTDFDRCPRRVLYEAAVREATATRFNQWTWSS